MNALKISQILECDFLCELDLWMFQKYGFLSLSNIQGLKHNYLLADQNYFRADIGIWANVNIQDQQCEHLGSIMCSCGTAVVMSRVEILASHILWNIHKRQEFTCLQCLQFWTIKDIFWLIHIYPSNLREGGFVLWEWGEKECTNVNNLIIWIKSHWYKNKSDDRLKCKYCEKM